MSELLPITQSDLAICAERWGWEYLEPRYSSTRIQSVVNGNLVRLILDRNDWSNASAILDRETWLIRKGIYGNVTLYGNHHVFTWNGTMNYIPITDEHIAAPNFRSWLLVQLTLALPPEVWK